MLWRSSPVQRLSHAQIASSVDFRPEPNDLRMAVSERKGHFMCHHCSERLKTPCRLWKLERFCWRIRILVSRFSLEDVAKLPVRVHVGYARLGASLSLPHGLGRMQCKARSTCAAISCPKVRLRGEGSEECWLKLSVSERRRWQELDPFRIHFSSANPSAIPPVCVGSYHHVMLSQKPHKSRGSRIEAPSDS